MTIGLCRRLAAVLLTYRITVGLCMDLAAVLLTYRMTVGLCMDLAAMLLKFHMMLGLRRHLFSSAFGVCPGDWASSMEKSQYDGDRLWHPPQEGRGQGASSYGPVHGAWPDVSGGGMSGAKAELPDLPASASPLEFGDWLRANYEGPFQSSCKVVVSHNYSGEVLL